MFCWATCDPTTSHEGPYDPPLSVGVNLAHRKSESVAHRVFASSASHTADGDARNSAGNRRRGVARLAAEWAKSGWIPWGQHTRWSCSTAY